jgi:hypothetical protein
VECQYGFSQFNSGVKLETGGDHDLLFNNVSPRNPVVVSSEASAAEREVMQEVLPEIYTSIRFTKFGS